MNVKKSSATALNDRYVRKGIEITPGYLLLNAMPTLLISVSLEPDYIPKNPDTVILCDGGREILQIDKTKLSSELKNIREKNVAKGITWLINPAGVDINQYFEAALTAKGNIEGLVLYIKE